MEIRPCDCHGRGDTVMMTEKVTETVKTMTRREGQRYGARKGTNRFLGAFLTALIIQFLRLSAPEASSAQSGQTAAGAVPEDLVLDQAMICESLKDALPVNAGVVFSSGVGKLLCHSSFIPFTAAVRRSVVFHCWYHRGQLSSKQRVGVHAPGFSASSSMQVREADKGPWQVEIVDGSGRVLRVLRFSVVD
jgi:hypothetical protein